MMVLKKICRLIKFLDFFKVSASIKYKGDDVSSIYGGIISIIAIVFTFILALPVFKDFLTFKNYTYTSNIQLKNQSLILDQKINFSLVIIGYQSEKRAFDINFQYIENKFGSPQQKKTNYSAVNCSKQYWTQHFGQIGKTIQTLNIGGQQYCSPQNLNMTLYGSYTSSDYSRVYISLKRCHAEDCLTDNQFKQVPPFYIFLGFPQMQFRLNQTQFLQYSMKQDLWFNVNPALKTTYNYHTNLQQVQINDQQTHIWPQFISSLFYQNKKFNGWKTQRSYLISNYQYNNYVSFTIMKSPTKKTINRRIIKLDQLISYIGGFLSALMGLGQLLVYSFNQKLLLMKSGKNIKFFNKNNHQQQQPLDKRFNIFNNLALSFFWDCIESRAQGTYNEKAKLLIDQMQHKCSIQNLLQRLARCQQTITRLSNDDKWIFKRIQIKASQLQNKKYTQSQEQQNENESLNISQQKFIEHNDYLFSYNKQQDNSYSLLRNIQTGTFLSNKKGKVILQQFTSNSDQKWNIQKINDYYLIKNNDQLLSSKNAKTGSDLICNNDNLFYKWNLRKSKGYNFIQLIGSGKLSLCTQNNKPTLQITNHQKPNHQWIFQL